MPVYSITVDGKERQIEVMKTGENRYSVKLDGKTRTAEATWNLDKESVVNVEGKTYHVKIPEIEKDRQLTVKVEQAPFQVVLANQIHRQAATPFEPAPTTLFKRTGSMRHNQVREGAVAAPMTGKVISVKAKKGDQVKKGQVLCVIEAMKMENEIGAPNNGVVADVLVSEGSPVNEGDPLIILN